MTAPFSNTQKKMLLESSQSMEVNHLYKNGLTTSVEDYDT
jgi:hypothetical protein